MEVNALLPSNIELLSLDDIHCLDAIPETAETIEENAKLKANHVKLHYNMNCFADDTGLEVTALGGEPGVYSARYAGPEGNADANMQKLLSRLEGKKDRSARFKTVIALTLETELLIFEGICEGTITRSPRGNAGFGYDPIFQPEGYESTFAEMPLSLKSDIGHRGKAIRQLIAYLSR